MRIENDLKLDFKDVLIRPKRSTLTSRREVDIARSFNLKWSGKTFEGVPIVAANMDGVGTTEMCQAFLDDGNGLSVALTKHFTIEQLKTFYKSPAAKLAWYSLGVSQSDKEKFQTAVDHIGLDALDRVCIDVANGYSEPFVEFVRKMREDYPDLTIMAGNVVTGEMVEELILSGADIVKVGIGPGSVCTTRTMTGVGYPQLSAIIECADAAHGLEGLVCADGGCSVPGDLAKAFGAGADFVMLGGMLAGHDQAGVSPEKDEDGNQIIKFYGMSSDTAMEKHSGGVAEYRASEGKTVSVPYRGDVADTLQQILGGLRSSCTYVGARRLKELSKRTSFVRVTQQVNTVFGNGG